MTAFDFTFRVDGRLIRWLRYGSGLTAVFELAKAAALREYPTAHGFCCQEATR